MKTAIWIIALLIGLLSIAAGAAKIALLPDEAAFLGRMGLSSAAIIAFGAFQAIAGLLMLLPSQRRKGAAAVAAGFALSALLLLLDENSAMAVISLVPLSLALFIASHTPARSAHS